MGVDFSALVLVPNMAVFGRAVEIDPVASSPPDPPYQARGIFSSRPINVQLDNGSVISSNETTLGIRDADFAVLPTRGDRCTLVDPQFGKQAGAVMWVADVQHDGQGGSTLLLRADVLIPL